MRGIGKTQAAHKYCDKVTTKYSIVDKISFKEGKSFSEVTKNNLHAARNYKYNVQYDTDTTSKRILENMRKYFYYKERQGYPYLLFIDNVDLDSKEYYNDIVSLDGLIYGVLNLDIILATPD